jgi:hypothetical protein
MSRDPAFRTACRSLIILIASLCTAGCEVAPATHTQLGNVEQALAFFDHADVMPELVGLTGELTNASPVMGRPSRLLVTDNYLWVQDAFGDPALHVLDARTGTHVRSMGRRGEGPGEFGRTSFGLLPDSPENAAVWAFDPANQRLLRFEPHHLPDSNQPIVRLASSLPIARVFRLPPDRFGGVTASDSSRFVLFDNRGNRLRTVPATLLGSEEMPRQERIRASTTNFTICVKPDSHAFAIVYGIAGRIDVYDAEAQFMHSVAVPYPSEVEFARDSITNRPVFRSHRRWYMDCAATNSFIYGLFSGRSSRAFSSGEVTSGEFVHVFSWDGVLRGVLKLDQAVRAIAVSGDSTMYASSLTEAAVYTFRLNP